ncbi:unnamed protein product [Nippostrongylus brasiliensis]|uniref:Uncharacterized protein n=1 Tax=Nippostrongylus brasiliensis TaxID=27835 RepID=A0A0N4Y2N7_NIPBR|nr:unnamed protein product [Nippostrongylus brasiliensis]
MLYTDSSELRLQSTFTAKIFNFLKCFRRQLNVRPQSSRLVARIANIDDLIYQRTAKVFHPVRPVFPGLYGFRDDTTKQSNQKKNQPMTIAAFGSVSSAALFTHMGQSDAI